MTTETAEYTITVALTPGQVNVLRNSNSASLLVNAFREQHPPLVNPWELDAGVYLITRKGWDRPVVCAVRRSLPESAMSPARSGPRMIWPLDINCPGSLKASSNWSDVTHAELLIDLDGLRRIAPIAS